MRAQHLKPPPGYPSEPLREDPPCTRTLYKQPPPSMAAHLCETYECGFFGVYSPGRSQYLCSECTGDGIDEGDEPTGVAARVAEIATDERSVGRICRLLAGQGTPPKVVVTLLSEVYLTAAQAAAISVTISPVSSTPRPSEASRRPSAPRRLT